MHEPSAYAPRLSAADVDGSHPALLEAPSIRWGILGAGAIASSFSDGVLARTTSTVTAVGSRDVAKAQAFADAHAPGARAHGSYEELVADPDVDVVYVATPHSHHLDHALLAIRAGKHVLVEKPITRNVAEAQAIVDAAKEAGVFLMEAMWTRFLPHIAAARGAIARGEIGTVVSVIADFDVAFPYDPQHRILNPDLAGGALLDLGVYPIAFAHDLLGAPDRITARGTLAPTGVDDQVAVILEWQDGRQALLHTSSRAAGPHAATIIGTEGRIEIPRSFLTPTAIHVTRGDGETWTYESPTGEGKVYEAAEVARQIAAGAVESPRHPWSDTIEIMEILDEVRRQIGVVYPGE